jgi:BirA family biotin operon repressor/biotin-[acetyl-CoA-carboxylase] ligase
MEINRISLLEIDSTNNYASNLMKSERLPHGTVITAQFQTQGRGQRENSWEGASDQNLAATWIFHFKDLKVANGFVYNQSIALAVRQSIHDWINQEVFIKWPNDIIVNDKKIAGILIENYIQGDDIKSSLCGIGVNIFQTQFSFPHATSLVLAGSDIASTDSFLQTLHKNLLEKLEELKLNPFVIREQYLLHLFRSKDLIALKHNEQVIHGYIQGVDEWGRLIFSIEKRIHHFQSGEIQWIWE